MSRLRVAIVLNSLVAIIYLVVGSNYLFRSTVTSYHLTAIGVDWETLPEGVQLMMVILMKGVGDALVVMALSVLVLTWIPLRQRQRWAVPAIWIIGAACIVPMLVGAITVASRTGAASPWWLNALLLAGLTVAAGLSWRPTGRHQRLEGGSGG